MEKSQKNINIRKTVEHSIAGGKDFHFYVDELAPDNTMPTYKGEADEKYVYKEMDDEFFDFLERKSNENGIFIRLVFSKTIRKDGSTLHELTIADALEEFKADGQYDEGIPEFVDYGIKVQNGEVTFGASINNDDRQFRFYEFGSAEEEFLSPDNPLNRRIVEIMEGMVK